MSQILSNKPVIRRATAADAPAVLRLANALAEYEKLEPLDDEAKKRLIRDMTRNPPRFECYLAEVEGQAVGYTMIFDTYASFLALPTLHLEDLFVLPAWRGKKIGIALFKAMVAEADRRGCGRMEWVVLGWNRLAIDFYDRIGGKEMDEWKYYRLTSEQIKEIATNL